MRWVLMWLMLFSTPVWGLCPPFLPEIVNMTFKHRQDVISAELAINVLTVTRPQLELRTQQGGTVLARYDLSTVGGASAFKASPLIEDTNLDGLADYIWLLSADGMLWRFSLQNGQLRAPQLMADLRDSGLTFIATVALLRSRLPTHLAPNRWRDSEQHLLLVVGRDLSAGNDVMLVLRFPVNHPPEGVTYFRQLISKPLSDRIASQVNPNGHQSADSAGWQLRLPGKISTTPLVIAGVLYVPVVISDVPAVCKVEHTEQQLFSLHLHTASRVYTGLQQRIPYVPAAQLALRQAAGKMQLVLRSKEQQVVVLSDMLAISEKCFDCVEPLSWERFPVLKRLATYRHEAGAH